MYRNTNSPAEVYEDCCNMANPLKKIPYLGLGIGLRHELHHDTLRYKDEIDCVEIISEGYFTNIRDEYLKIFTKEFSVIPHGIKLSISSPDPVEEWYFEGMNHVNELVNAHYYSDHFTLSRHGRDIDCNHLAPIWYTKEMLEHVVRKIDTVQQRIGMPLVLENITSALTLGEADFEEWEFISKVFERTQCGLLLDLTNININAYNTKQDPIKLLGQYPMDAVVQIHLAGGFIDHHEDYFHDTHSREVVGPNEPVWDLLEWTTRHADIKALVIERDQNFEGEFEDMIMKDLRKARSIVEPTQDSAAVSGLGAEHVVA